MPHPLTNAGFYDAARSRYAAYPHLLAAEGAASAIDARLWECACVTGSVPVGTQRDGQDTAGRDAIIEPYLA